MRTHKEKEYLLCKDIKQSLLLILNGHNALKQFYGLIVRDILDSFHREQKATEKFFDHVSENTEKEVPDNLEFLWVTFVICLCFWNGDLDKSRELFVREEDLPN